MSASIVATTKVKMIALPVAAAVCTVPQAIEKPSALQKISFGSTLAILGQQIFDYVGAAFGNDVIRAHSDPLNHFSFK